MKITHRHRALTGLVLGLLSLAAQASAQLYTFELITDTRSGFIDLGLFPSINAAGTVAFRAESAGSSGIFTGNGGGLTTVADSSSSFADFGSLDPRINAAGTVAFFANLSSGGSGLFVNSAGVNSKIADTSDNFSTGDLFEAFGSPSLNAAGVVAFAAAAASGDLGVFTGTAGGAPTRVGPASTGTFSALAGRAFINENGAVAVVATTTGGDTQVLTALPPAEFSAAVATSGPLSSAIDTVTPYLTSDGLSVIILGTRETGERGIFRVTGGVVTTLVDASGGFQDFNDFALAADGSLLAFSAVTDDGRSGIFNGNDVVLNKVIATGDLIAFGVGLRQVDSLSFGDAGLNDSGQLSFYATFTDSLVPAEPGFAAVFRASPIPEPGSTALVLAGGGLLVLAWRRHSRSS